jgi:hypothetical protein
MAKAAVSGATSGLNSFLLKPDGLIGDSLFMHMVQKRLFDPKVRDLRPSSYLEVEFNVSQIGYEFCWWARGNYEASQTESRQSRMH